jgi:methylated-DNA-protein-cysteine methyltransferase-like protein
MATLRRSQEGQSRLVRMLPGCLHGCSPLSRRAPRASRHLLVRGVLGDEALTSRVRSEPKFFLRVYALVRRIPRGRVTSYGAIARALGAPRGARTVGWALSACKPGVPWHRVVNAGGKISWRPTGGPRLQRVLLKREGVRFDREGRIDLDAFGWRTL